MSGSHWDDDEIATVRRLYGRVPCAKIADMLPGRTVRGVREKARRLGKRSTLHRTGRPRKYPPEFYQGILERVSRDKRAVVALELGVPEGTLSAWVSRARWDLLTKKRTPGGRDACNRGWEVDQGAHSL